ncbi:hypothetical protein [Pasteuria penetrans]|uniref:hypothetical protein n=1 Tax=Pasteuria penetrans TaxID=86005 RepID=UPI001CAA5A6A|nr:hypothetical protein [Pasteuria penetrans]
MNVGARTMSMLVGSGWRIFLSDKPCIGLNPLSPMRNAKDKELPVGFFIPLCLLWYGGQVRRFMLDSWTRNVIASVMRAFCNREKIMEIDNFFPFDLW